MREEETWEVTTDDEEFNTYYNDGRFFISQFIMQCAQMYENGELNLKQLNAMTLGAFDLLCLRAIETFRDLGDHHAMVREHMHNVINMMITSAYAEKGKNNGRAN